MLQSPLPQWVRDSLQEMLDGYRAALPLIEERCGQIEAGGRKNEKHKLCDDLGSINDWHNEGKYCAGQTTRLRAVMQGRTPPDEWEKSYYREIPMDPRKMAAWAWQNKLKNIQPVPDPQDAKTYRLKEFMRQFTEREAHALILTEACRLTAGEAAEVMGLTERTVNDLIYRARKRCFGSNTDS